MHEVRARHVTAPTHPKCVGFLRAGAMHACGLQRLDGLICPGNVTNRCLGVLQRRGATPLCGKQGERPNDDSMLIVRSLRNHVS